MILFNDIALDMLLVFKYLSILINLSFLNDFLMNNKGNFASSITLYFSMLSSSNSLNVNCTTLSFICFLNLTFS